MEEKSEQLKLTKKRLKMLKWRIGKNIIDSFQKTDQKNVEDQKEKTMSEAEQIEEILEEANAYDLRWEVDEWAKKAIKKNPTLSKLDAYVLAYQEWVK